MIRRVLGSGLFLLLCLLLVSSAFATDIEVVVVDNNIGPDESAQFEVTITNTGLETQDYSLYSLSTTSGWQIDPSPLSDKVIEDLPAGESLEVLILASPVSESLEPGIYQLNLEVDGSKDDEAISVPLKVYLGSGSIGGEYLPSISVEVELDDRVKTLEPVSVVLHLRNGNSLDLDDLNLRIESDIEEFNVNIPIGLEAFEEKTTEFSIELSAFTQPKEYVLFFVFESGSETVKVVDEKLTVETYVPDFEAEIELESTFLKREYVLTLYNAGNAENSQEYLYPISFFSSFFVGSDEGRVLRQGSQSYVLWDVQIEPGQSQNVFLTLNYRVLFYLLGFAIFLLIFYLLVRSPVSISKKGIVVLGDDNGLSEVKVLLEIRNKRKIPVRDVEILDQVPGIANVERTLQLGTLKPNKVTHSKKGSKIHWSLSELDGLEQRIITYKIKAKLNILGQFQLPRAQIEYTTGKDKRKKSFSNLFRMDTEIREK
ncbi:hypothetical protein HOC01_00070 [archaeon]|nr:hypothetical protein [archaeon]MBT6698764.1 hypothetical protein [archaeon]